VTGLICAIACALACATPAAANPLLAQDLPDPTVLRTADGFWLSGTSDTLAPVFPLWHSPDLRTWRRVGAVLPRAPEWSRGAFWAPELAEHDGRYFLYFSASEKGGKPCLAVATAARPEGPWSEATRVLCRPGGVIDASQPVTDTDGSRWLAYKEMGAGGGLHLRRLTGDGLGVTGPEHLLLEPSKPWEYGVTEGPALVRRGAYWYLFYSGGNCCGPPCRYVEGVARSPTLTGDYARKPGGPILTAQGDFKCPGHGTPVDLDTGPHLVHHAIRADDPANRRRLPLLSRIEWGADDWPTMAFADVPPAAPAGWSEGFAGPALGPHWEWRFDRAPAVRLTRSALHARCDRAPAYVTRQVELDRFTAVVATRDGIVAGRDREGVVRGIEVDGGRARAVLGTRRGPWSRVRAGGRVLLTFGPDGTLTATVGGVAVPAVLAREGTRPVRLALGCGTFASARVRAT
jgi:hypothetical protein